MTTLYDQYGRPLHSEDKKPIEREIAAVSIRDRWSSYPTKGLTPQKLATIFKEADTGHVARQAEMFEEMEEKDAHLYSLLQTRKNSVLGLNWTLLPYSDDPKDLKVLEFIQQALEFEGFEDSLLDLLDAIGKGYSALEIMWEVSEGNAWARNLQHVPAKRFVFDDYGRIRLRTEEELVRGIPLVPDKFVLHLYKARSGHPSRSGILRVCAWMYLFKIYGVKDWVTFAEVYGMPLRLGKYDASSTQEDKDSLIQAVSQLGSDAAGIISKSTEIEFVEAIKGNSNIFQTLCSFCNTEMSKAILGQTLTSEVGSSGSYAASKTHNEVRQDLIEADCKALAETLRRDLIRPLVRFNFGEDAAHRLPYIKFHYEPPEDLKAEADTYKVLIQDIGLPVATEHLYEKFGVPKPKDGQELLQTKTAPMNVGAFKDTSVNKPSLKPQQQIDRMADQMLLDSVAVTDQMLSPIEKLLNEVNSLEELRDRIYETYDNINDKELEQMIQQALFIADLYGRWTANG